MLMHFMARMVLAVALVLLVFALQAQDEAACHFIDFDLDIDQTEYVQVYDIQFAGPMVFARFRF